MAIIKIISCDYCEKEIKNNPPLTILGKICEVKLERHFCTFNCMKKYIDEKWP